MAPFAIKQNLYSYLEKQSAYFSENDFYNKWILLADYDHENEFFHKFFQGLCPQLRTTIFFNNRNPATSLNKFYNKYCINQNLNYFKI